MRPDLTKPVDPSLLSFLKKFGTEQKTRLEFKMCFHLVLPQMASGHIEHSSILFYPDK